MSHLQLAYAAYAALRGRHPASIRRFSDELQLLAMKLAAWRDALDRADAGLLLSQMTGSAADVWTAIAPFVPPRHMDKASYAFEDLWEATHGRS